MRPPADFARSLARSVGLTLCIACGPNVTASGGLALYPSLAASDAEPCSSAVERIEHPAEPTALGFSAAQLLARLAGQTSSPLVWLEPPHSDEYILAFGPERGTSTLSLSVSAADGDILYRYWQPLPDAPPGTECAPDRLEVPVQVTIQSGAQALDETFYTVLEASVPYRAFFSKAFAPGALAGGLSFAKLSSLDPERSFWLGALTLDVLLWPGGSQGSLSLELGAAHAKASKQVRPAPLAAGSPGPLALWPSSSACEAPFQHLPSEAQIMGFSARDVLAALDAEAEQELEWSDGSVTQLDLTFMDLPSQLCQASEDTLEFEGEVIARTQDGRVDARLSVLISAAPERGSIGEIWVRQNGPGERTEGSESDAAGQLGADPHAHSSVLVDIEATYHGARGSGSLSLSGMGQPAPGAEGTPTSGLMATGRWAR